MKGLERFNYQKGLDTRAGYYVSVYRSTGMLLFITFTPCCKRDVIHVCLACSIPQSHSMYSFIYINESDK